MKTKTISKIICKRNKVLNQLKKIPEVRMFWSINQVKLIQEILLIVFKVVKYIKEIYLQEFIIPYLIKHPELL